MGMRLRPVSYEYAVTNLVAHITHDGGRAKSVYGGGLPEGADLRAAVLALRIPHLPGARCRDHADLFDYRSSDDPRTASALALCQQCPSLKLCEDWLRSLPGGQRPTGVIAGRIYKGKGVIPKRKID